MAKLSRLSDLNIEDPILRASYYTRVKNYVDDIGSDLKAYEIKIDEEYRPDLVAYRAFGDANLEWIVLFVSEVIDPFEPLPVGETIYLPYPSWIRRSMREFMDEYGL